MPEDEEGDRRPELAVDQFEELFEELEDRVDDVQSELDHLEDSGEADRQPVKHQQAVDKASKIQEQLEDLRDALKGVKDRS